MAASIQKQYDGAEPFAGTTAADPVTIAASPFRWPDHRSLPRRPWVWGRWLLLGTVSAIVAPGGVGKSSFVASMLLSLASGRQEILGKTVWAGPKRVWYWNLEDGLAELEMQLIAASMFHGVGQDACGDRIYLDSGPEGAELRIAIEDRNGYSIAIPVVEALVAELLARKIDVLIIDPFVSSHGVSENDNSAIDAVVKTWTSIAKRAGCAIVLVHHSKKLGNEKVTAESSRGASALVSAARVTLVLNRMDKEESQRFGIAEDKERRRLFTVQDDKANRAPAEDAQWFRLASQTVNNCQGPDDPFGDEGDSVGVVTRWTPPDAFDGVTVDHLYQVQQRVADGQWRADVQAKEWVGKVVADVIGVSGESDAKVDRAKINGLLRSWVANGALVKVEGKDGKSMPRTYVEVGEWAVQGVAPTSTPKVWKGVEGVGPSSPHHTSPPIGEVVGKRGLDAGNEVWKSTPPPEESVVFSERGPARSTQGMILAPGETGDDVEFD
ncbi:MAG: helicase RepA family protein [Pseudomonadota bacterium]|nr:helicase RepA family protein [Pseudomonadota bacterium]